MSGTIISGSPNISILDARLAIDMCSGDIKVDVTPSTFLSGSADIIGVKIQLSNDYGTFRAFPSGNTYDIEPPFTDVFEYAIPLQLTKYVYGTYTATIQLTDEDERVHTVVKTRKICAFPDSGLNCAEAIADCKAGTLTIVINKPPVYQGKEYESVVQAWTVKFPTGTLPDQESSEPGFSVKLYEGNYRILGEVCATYNFGDHIYVSVGYDADFEKPVKCYLDYTCIEPRVRYFQEQLYGNSCTDKEREYYSAIILETFGLIGYIEMAIDAGADPSFYVGKLETLLGCSCTCGCGASSQVIDGTPAANIQINGCGFTSTTVGLTKIFTLNNYSYVVTADPAQNIITATSPSLADCVYTTQFGFNVANAYAAIKGEVDNSTEYNFWANVTNLAIANIDTTALDCIGLTTGQWNAFTLKAKIQYIASLFCANSSVTGCAGTVSSDPELFSQNGNDVTVPFTATDCAYVMAFLDGVFVTTVAVAIGEVVFEGAANGSSHNFILYPVCENGNWGTPYQSSFSYLGCPTIAPPFLTSNTANGVDCPYDMTGLLEPLPAGITAEWHNANNTNPATIIDATQVITGVYYVFAKNANGCYSIGVPVTVTCASGGTTVTAPQNIGVQPVFGGYRVSFESPTFPPSPEAYIIKRRLESDSDIDGNYTVIAATGTANDITFNPSTNRYEANDPSAVQNVLYVYRAVSDGGALPYADFMYANIICPSIGTTADGTDIDFTFSNSGGEIDKYIVEGYNSTGVTLIDSATFNSPFSSPVTGTLQMGAYGTYQGRIKAYIGTYEKVCPFASVVLAANTITGQTTVDNGDDNGSGTFNVDNPLGGTVSISAFSSVGNVTIQVTIGAAVYSTVINNGLSNQNNTTTFFLAQGSYAYTITLTGGVTSNGSISITP